MSIVLKIKKKLLHTRYGSENMKLVSDKRLRTTRKVFPLISYWDDWFLMSQGWKISPKLSYRDFGPGFLCVENILHLLRTYKTSYIFAKFCLKWVQMGDYGLILCEDEALHLISTFRPVLHRKTKSIEKLPINRPSGRYVIIHLASVLYTLWWIM